MNHDSQQPVIRVEGVSKLFSKKLDLAAKIARRLGVEVSEQTVRAVEKVSFSINSGEVVGLVGESGCGKSTLGRVISGLIDPSAGRVLYRDQTLEELKEKSGVRSLLKIQMIFQDPFASLNPRMQIRDSIGEAPLHHKLISRPELDSHVEKTLQKCGLDPSFGNRYPHQFSGGQRQRIVIARALAVNPEFIVCDEAVAALDVSIQAQILNLFIRLKEELHLTYLFISHDIGVVEHISDRIFVMYLGRVVESGLTDEIFAHPNHPYTKVLLREVPRLENRKIDFHPVEGEIPSPLDPPPGCHFHPRCPFAEKKCREQVPPLRSVSPGHFSACHLDFPDGE